MRRPRPLALALATCALLVACPSPSPSGNAPSARPIPPAPSPSPSLAFVRPPSPEGPQGVQPIGGLGTGSLATFGPILVAGDASPAPSPLAPGDERPPLRQGVDQADGFDGPQVKPILLLPLDGDDRGLDVGPEILRSVEAIDAWFARQAGRRLRWDRANGNPDVGFVRSRFRASELRATDGRLDRAKVLASLVEAGFEAQHKCHAVWYDGPTNSGALACSELTRAQDPTAGLALLDVRACAGAAFGAEDRSFQQGEAFMAHELLHALGAVPACAPRHEGGHVSGGGDDLMRPLPPVAAPLLDPGSDDYFGHGQEGCLDLARSPFFTPADPRVQGPFGFARSAALPSEAQALPLRVQAEGNGVKLLGALAADGAGGAVDVAFRIVASGSGGPGRLRLKLDGRWLAMSVGAPKGREAQALACINPLPNGRGSLLELYAQSGQDFLPNVLNPGTRLMAFEVRPDRGAVTGAFSLAP